MELAPSQSTESPFVRFRARILAARFLVVSLLFHVVLVMIFGGTILFKRVMEPPEFVAEGGFVETAPAQPTPAEPINSMPQYAPPQLNAGGAMAAAGPAMPVLTVNAAAAFDVPSVPQAPAIDASMLSQSLSKGTGAEALATSSGLGQGGAGSGVGTGLGSGAGKGGSIGGMKISARRLAVALDASGSVKQYIEEMQALVKKSFHGSEVGEFKSAGFKTDTSKGKSMGTVVLDFLKSSKHFDAIYIFSDFGETRDEQPLWKEAEELLRKEKVKLYLHVLRESGKEGRINEQLAEIIAFAKHSGGRVKIGPMNVKESE